MKEVIGLIIVAFLAVGGCGGSSGGGGGCDFDFDAFLNGPNAGGATSQWNCVSEETGIFAFQAFEDGTAFSSDLGPITYEQTGCRSARFDSGFGTASVVDLDGSIQSGILTYDQTSNDPSLDIGPVGCELILF